MKMELIQPFINAADAIFADVLHCSTRIDDVSMDEEIYRRKGTASVVNIRGDIEGRVILDLAPETAMKVASHLAGGPVDESEETVRETVNELANMVIGNAITLLNDQGFRFKVYPPEAHAGPLGLAGNHETEALVMSFDTPSGLIYLNIAMHYNRRRKAERAAVVTS
jgi:chemotaxis protein CheX